MEKSLIRLRMSAHDAHYGGNLVDGARMLQLFGDVATELLIKHDGDEGLFAGYDNIEFLAPVYAGDYIEATGEIVHVGNSSRKMVFEARKVVITGRIYQNLLRISWKNLSLYVGRAVLVSFRKNVNGKDK